MQMVIDSDIVGVWTIQNGKVVRVGASMIEAACAIAIDAPKLTETGRV